MSWAKFRPRTKNRLYPFPDCDLRDERVSPSAEDRLATSDLLEEEEKDLRAWAAKILYYAEIFPCDIILAEWHSMYLDPSEAECAK